MSYKNHVNIMYWTRRICSFFQQYTTRCAHTQCNRKEQSHQVWSENQDSTSKASIQHGKVATNQQHRHRNQKSFPESIRMEHCLLQMWNVAVGGWRREMVNRKHSKCNVTEKWWSWVDSFEVKWSIYCIFKKNINESRENTLYYVIVWASVASNFLFYIRL